MTSSLAYRSVRPVSWLGLVLSRPHSVDGCKWHTRRLSRESGVRRGSDGALTLG